MNLSGVDDLTAGEPLTAEALEELAQTFRAGRLPRRCWTHRAHLLVGLWHVRRFGVEGAMEELRHHIRAHNHAVGTANSDSSGYHETLTRFYLDAIAAFDAADPGRPLPQAAAALLASPLADASYPLRSYRRERLYSSTARRRWLPPERDVPASG